MMDSVRYVLDQVNVMSLATADEHGTPYAANVYFAADEQLNIYFVSSASTAHSQHVLSRAEVAITIYPEVDGYRKIHGLQLRGCATPVAGDAWEAAWEIYLNKFTFVAKLAAMVKSQQVFCCKPHWIRFIDNRVAFGHKWETVWPPPSPSGR